MTSCGRPASVLLRSACSLRLPLHRLAVANSASTRAASSSKGPAKVSLDDSAPKVARRGRKPKVQEAETAQKEGKALSKRAEKVTDASVKAKRTRTSRPETVILGPDGKVLRRRRRRRTQDEIARGVQLGDEEYEHLRKARLLAKKSHGESLSCQADPSTPFPHLPDIKHWNKGFEKSRNWLKSHRFFLANEATVEAVADEMDLGKRSEQAGRKLTILEGYPGVGTVTRRLMTDDNIERVVSMEDHDGYVPWLRSLLTDESMGNKASRLSFVNESCYSWDTYTDILRQGLLDHVPAFKVLRDRKADVASGLFNTPEWKAGSPVVFFAHLPTSVHGEQLLAQLITAIANRLWMFQYARMPMFFVCSEHVAQRCIAPPNHRLRGKMSLLAQALTNSRIVMDSTHFLPHEEHFWPDTPDIGPRLPITRTGGFSHGKMSTGMAKVDNCLLLVEPKIQPLISGAEMDSFEYVLRNLFVLKRHSVSSALKHMAPGADNILKMLHSGHPVMETMGPIEIDPETIVMDLTVEQFVCLAKLFDRWPFRPVHLFEDGRLLVGNRSRGSIL